MLRRCYNEVEGFGFGQVLEIDEDYKTAVIQVDSSTWHLIDKCREVRDWGIGPLTLDKLIPGVVQYRIKADLNLPMDKMYDVLDMDLSNPLDSLFGIPLNFQWRMYKHKHCRCVKIVVEWAKYAPASNWSRDRFQDPPLKMPYAFSSCHDHPKADSDYCNGNCCLCPDVNSDDDSEEESDESDESDEEEAPVMKFFREFCLPMAEIPEQKAKVEIPAVVRPARRRKHASS